MTFISRFALLQALFCRVAVTIDLHLNQRAQNPAIKMLQTTKDQLRNRAEVMKDRLFERLAVPDRDWLQHRQSRRWHIAQIDDAVVYD